MNSGLLSYFTPGRKTTPKPQGDARGSSSSGDEEIEVNIDLTDEQCTAASGAAATMATEAAATSAVAQKKSAPSPLQRGTAAGDNNVDGRLRAIETALPAMQHQLGEVAAMLRGIQSTQQQQQGDAAVGDVAKETSGASSAGGEFFASPGRRSPAAVAVLPLLRTPMPLATTSVLGTSDATLLKVGKPEVKQLGEDLARLLVAAAKAARVAGTPPWEAHVIVAEALLSFVRILDPLEHAESSAPLSRPAQWFVLRRAVRVHDEWAVVGDAFVRQHEACDTAPPWPRALLLQLASSLAATQALGALPLQALVPPPRTLKATADLAAVKRFVALHSADGGTGELGANRGVCVTLCATLAAMQHKPLEVDRSTEVAYVHELLEQALAERRVEYVPFKPPAKLRAAFDGKINASSSLLLCDYSSLLSSSVSPLEQSASQPIAAHVAASAPHTDANEAAAIDTEAAAELGTALTALRSKASSLTAVRAHFADGKTRTIAFDTMCEVGIIRRNTARDLGLHWAPMKLAARGADGVASLSICGVTKNALQITVGGARLVLRRLLVMRAAEFPIFVGNMQLHDADNEGAALTITPLPNATHLQYGSGKPLKCVNGDGERLSAAHAQAMEIDACALQLDAAHSAPTPQPHRLPLMPTAQSPYGTRVTTVIGDRALSEQETKGDTLLVPLPAVCAVLELELQPGVRYILGDVDAHANDAVTPFVCSTGFDVPEFNADTDTSSAYANERRTEADPDAWRQCQYGDAEPTTSSGPRLSERALTELRSVMREFNAALNVKASDGTSKAPNLVKPAAGVLWSAKIHHNADIDSMRAVPRRRSVREAEALRADAMRRLAKGTARRAKPGSPFMSIAHPVGKYDASGQRVSTRVVVDFKAINANTYMDAHPLPDQRDLLAYAAQGEFRSFFDWAAAYEQVPVEEKSIPLTTTYFDHDLVLELTAATFGLHGMVGIMQRFATRVFHGLARPFLDDMAVSHATEADVVSDVRRVMERAIEVGVTFSASKLVLGVREGTMLGHTVGKGFFKPNPTRIAAFAARALPATGKELKSWYHALSNFRWFMPFWSADTAALRPLMIDPRKRINWEANPVAARDFEAVRARVATAALAQAVPPRDAKLILATDWAKRADCGGGGFGWMIYWLDSNNDPRSVIGASRALTDTQNNYNQVTGELFCVREALRTHGYLLKGTSFTWQTDCQPLVKLFAKSNVKNDMIARILLELQEYDGLEPQWLSRDEWPLQVTDLFSKRPRRENDGDAEWLEALGDTAVTHAAHAQAAAAPLAAPQIVAAEAPRRSARVAANAAQREAQAPKATPAKPKPAKQAPKQQKRTQAASAAKAAKAAAAKPKQPPPTPQRQTRAQAARQAKAAKAVAAAPKQAAQSPKQQNQAKALHAAQAVKAAAAKPKQAAQAKKAAAAKAVAMVVQQAPPSASSASKARKRNGVVESMGSNEKQVVEAARSPSKAKKQRKAADKALAKYYDKKRAAAAAQAKHEEAAFAKLIEVQQGAQALVAAGHGDTVTQPCDATAALAVLSTELARFRAAQWHDVALEPLRALAGGVAPDSLRLSKSKCKTFLALAPAFDSRGVLTVAARSGGEQRRVVVPAGFYTSTVHAVHGGGSAKGGHFDAASTTHNLAGVVWWPAMYSVVASVVRSCEPCQLARESRSRKACAGAPLLNVGKFRSAIVDFHGSIQGKSILRVVYAGSRFMATKVVAATKPSAKQTATAFKAALRNLPWPRFITCDRGNEFRGEFREAMRRMRIRVRYNAPFNPQSHGDAERRNLDGLKGVAKLRQSTSCSFEDAVEALTDASNRRVLGEAGVSPFEAFFGSPPPPPLEFMAPLLEAPDDMVPATPEALAVQSALRCDEALQCVHSERLKRNRKQEESNELRFGKRRVYNVGDRVVYFGETINEKLPQATNKVGTYYIVEVFDGGNSASLALWEAPTVVVRDKVAVRHLATWHDPTQCRAMQADQSFGGAVGSLPRFYSEDYRETPAAQRNKALRVQRGEAQ